MKSAMRSVFLLSSLTILLAGCDRNVFSEESNELSVKQVSQIMPARKDKEAWASDMINISKQFKIPVNAENMCTIIAIIDQESNFNASPAVSGLGQTAVKEIKKQLDEKLGSTMGGYFENMLNTKPTPENSYLKQISRVKTEQELDMVYREMFDYYTKTYKVNLLTNITKLVGQDIAENFNPVSTLGSMQVHIDYAKAHKRNMMNVNQLRDDLYTRNGGLYYGIHRLMLYQAKYDKPLYRFADYNAGMYSSRNASFQQMLSQLTGVKLDLDGDLLLYDKGGDPLVQKSTTEDVLMSYFSQDTNAPNPIAIRRDLKTEKTQDFENTATYQYIRLKYEAKFKKNAPYAIMPQVAITGPKVSRDLKTNWYAENVNKRYTTCMSRAKRL
ncbi:DUF1615 family protein [Acinetobacter sp. c1-l78]|uniref:DUF1615 family protein n=1 Tax=Acinetobacter sp. c1-l78 TaxID=3342803 RepID=UPI0035B6C37C